MKPLDINQICRKAGLTQSQLGAIVGVKQPTVAGWRKGVPPAHVLKIAQATSIPASKIRPDIYPD